MYVNGDMEKKLKELEEWIEGKEERVRMIIEDDFNARTGCSGGVGVDWVGKKEVGCWEEKGNRRIER